MSHQAAARAGHSPSVFSDYFGVSRQIVEGYGAFDISLVTDMPLFVDPFLLFASKESEYREHSGFVGLAMALPEQGRR